MKSSHRRLRRLRFRITYLPLNALNNTFVNNTFANNTFANNTFANNTFVNNTFVNNTFVNNTFVNKTKIASWASGSAHSAMRYSKARVQRRRNAESVGGVTDSGGVSRVAGNSESWDERVGWEWLFESTLLVQHDRFKTFVAVLRPCNSYVSHISTGETIFL
jgi:hypothetical protein